MKYPILFFAFLLGAGSAMSQTTQYRAAPIPRDAEKRFCYYNGLAYSKNAYIRLSVKSPDSFSETDTKERLLRCVKDGDGYFSWVPESAIVLRN